MRRRGGRCQPVDRCRPPVLGAAQLRLGGHCRALCRDHSGFVVVLVVFDTAVVRRVRSVRLRREAREVELARGYFFP